MTDARLNKTKLVKLTLPPLHPRQKEFVDDPRRVVVAACGTKTGKTFGLAIWLIREAWNREQGLVWWTAPTYKQAQIAFKLIGNILPPGRYKKRASQGEMVYELLYTDGRTRSIIDFRSAERSESLRGEGVHAAVIDEAGYWKIDSFISVWTTLTRTMGKLRIISTPKGRNWFYDEWIRGWCLKCKQSKHTCPCTDNKTVTDTSTGRPRPLEYSSYQLPTAANPTVPRQAITMAKDILSEKQFQQEFMAEFLADGAGVFTKIQRCQRCDFLAQPIPGRQYVIGIDWAKEDDYTVFLAMDAISRKVVGIERFNGEDWNVSIDRAVKYAKFWNRAAVIMDSTGVGSVPLDMMSAVYPVTEGYNIYNNAPKVALVQRLQLALSREEIQLPRLQTGTPNQNELAAILEHELLMYTATISKQGKFQYSAPEGYTDDLVVALALATWKASEDPMIYRHEQVAGV